MLTAERCRVRAAECQRMAAQAPNARVQDILIDMARTWMRLALEAEQWTQMNRPSTRLTKAAPKNAAGEPIKLTPLPSRVSRRENSLVTPETPPDRTPVPTRKRASAPGALNLAMRRHPVLSGRPGRFYPIGASRFALTACVARRRMFDSRPLWARLRANSPRHQCARCFSAQIGGR